LFGIFNMLAIFLTIIISFFATTLFGHVVHWSLHQTWTGSVHKAHMTHHLKLYPPEDYTSVIYRDAGQDSTPRFFAIAAIPMVLAPILLFSFGVLPLHLMVITLIVEGLMGFLHNYLHDAFHIEKHWLYDVPVFGVIFGKWVALHYLHHVKMETNYGIFQFHWDRFFGTYWKG